MLLEMENHFNIYVREFYRQVSDEFPIIKNPIIKEDILHVNLQLEFTTLDVILKVQPLNQSITVSKYKLLGGSIFDHVRKLAKNYINDAAQYYTLNFDPEINSEG